MKAYIVHVTGISEFTRAFSVKAKTAFRARQMAEDYFKEHWAEKFDRIESHAVADWHKKEEMK